MMNAHDFTTLDLDQLATVNGGAFKDYAMACARGAIEGAAGGLRGGWRGAVIGGVTGCVRRVVERAVRPR
jgi:hypothetical protein